MLTEFAATLKKYVRTLFLFLFKPEYVLRVDGVQVKYSTRRFVAKRWFYPRYAGSRMHEPSLTRLILHLSRSSTCFVDAGAHIGYFTCIAAKGMSADPDSQVHAFELSRTNCEILMENVNLNDLSNVTCNQLAVSDCSDETVKYETKNRAGVHQINDDGESDVRASTDVKTITLDDYFSTRSLMPDLIKIDVEGYEMKVLEGMSEIISTTKPRLLIEVHPDNMMQVGSSAQALLSRLRDAGYSLYLLEDFQKAETVEFRPFTETTLETKNMLIAVSSSEDLRL